MVSAPLLVNISTARWTSWCRWLCSADPAGCNWLFFFLYPAQQRYLSITEDLGGRRDVWSCSEFSWCVKCSQSLRKKQLTSTLQGCCGTILFLICVEKYAKQKMIIYDKPRTSAKLADSMQKSSTTSPQTSLIENGVILFWPTRAKRERESKKHLWKSRDIVVPRAQQTRSMLKAACPWAMRARGGIDFQELVQQPNVYTQKGHLGGTSR